MGNFLCHKNEQQKYTCKTYFPKDYPKSKSQSVYLLQASEANKLPLGMEQVAIHNSLILM